MEDCLARSGDVVSCPAMIDLRSSADPSPARASLVEGAYDALKAAIRNNVFPPGYQGSEQEIATQLGMSRTPVHEAIIRLQEEGLVRVLPRRGVVVCALSPDDMREIYEAIIALESMAAELLAGQPDAARLPVAEALGEATQHMQTALEADELPAWAAADEWFHRVLIERCGNRRLMRMVHTVMDQSHRARMLTLRLRPKPLASVGQHRAIVDAIRRGDATAAREAARLHRSAARDQLLPLLGTLGMKHL